MNTTSVLIYIVLVKELFSFSRTIPLGSTELSSRKLQRRVRIGQVPQGFPIFSRISPNHKFLPQLFPAFPQRPSSSSQAREYLALLISLIFPLYQDTSYSPSHQPYPRKPSSAPLVPGLLWIGGRWRGKRQKTIFPQSLDLTAPDT